MNVLGSQWMPKSVSDTISPYKNAPFENAPAHCLEVNIYFVTQYLPLKYLSLLQNIGKTEKIIAFAMRNSFPKTLFDGVLLLFKMAERTTLSNM